MPGTEKLRGPLEKRREWLGRTRDFQRKSAQIKQLKQRARERNPDEFHFHMLRSQVGLDGVHRDLDSDEEEEEQTEAQRLLTDVGDLKYVRFHLGRERKKIEKLKSILHFCAQDDPSGPKNKHTIFTETEREAMEFDPTAHFGTPEQFLARAFNRPKTTEEGEGELEGSSRKRAVKLLATEKERRKMYAELGKRMERERELAIVLRKLEIKKDLALSGGRNKPKPKLIHKGDSGSAAIYKWTYERKK